MYASDRRMQIANTSGDHPPPPSSPEPRPVRLRVSVAAQTLELLAADSGEVLRTFPVSTSRFGLGTEPGSFRTPLGRFRVGEKIGDGLPPGTAFLSREPDGTLGPEDALASDAEDLILSRILWLEGLEPHNANTRERFIYIHGTNHEAHIGQPASHGCVRMRNEDIVELYDTVAVGTEIIITEAAGALAEAAGAGGEKG